MVWRHELPLERRRRAGQERSRPPRLRLPPDRRRDLARGVGRRQHVGQAGRARSPRPRDARAARQGQRLRSQDASSTRTSPACAWTTCSPCSSAQDMGDQEMVDYLAHALQEPGGPAPVHRDPAARLPARARGRPHARRRGRVAHQQRPQRATCSRERLRQGRHRALDYRRPGFLISREVARHHRRASGGARARCSSKHGTICWGATVREAYEATIELISRAEEAIADAPRGRARFGGVARARARPGGAAAAWRSRWRRSCAGWSGATGARSSCFDDAPAVLEFVGLARGAGALRRSGPPRRTTRSTPSGCRASCRSTSRRSARRSAAGVDARGRALRGRLHRLLRGAQHRGRPSCRIPFPRVVLVAGLGMFTTGKDRRTAGIVNDIYHHTIVGHRQRLRVRPLRVADREGRLRRRVLAARALQAHAGPAGEGAGPAHRARHRRRPRHRPRGGAAAGRRGRARGGRPTSTRRARARRPRRSSRPWAAGRALGLGMDVTSEASVRAAFEATVLDLRRRSTSSSPTPASRTRSPVDRMALADWERSFAVNSTGHFLVAREAHARAQGRRGSGGAFVFVATKNVMSPGKDFAAYSASKAAEAQLAKVLALEGAPHGIRSNIVNPDAVFQRLEALVRGRAARARARRRASRVDELEDFYRKRNLLAAAASCPRTSRRRCSSSPPTARPRPRAARSPSTAA